MCIFICILNHITDFEGMWGAVPWWNSLLLTTESYAAGSEVCTEQPCSLLCFLCLISSFFWLLHLEVICRGQDTDCNSSTVSYAATVSLKVESEICIITTINSNMQVLWSSLIRVSQSILQKEKALEHFFFFYWRKLFSSFSQGFLLVLMEIDLATVTLAAPLLWLPDSAPSHDGQKSYGKAGPKLFRWRSGSPPAQRSLH